MCGVEDGFLGGLDALDAVIWDAGGTLFDTYPAVVAAAQTALASFGQDLPAARLMSLFRRSTGYALHAIAADLDLGPESLTARFRAAYEAVDARYQRPFPHVVEVCRTIKCSGRRNFVVTHRGRASLMSLLEAHGMVELFSDCITQEDPYPRKPDPTSLLVLMDRHGLVPQRCLVVGDRKLDILAGAAAGAITCLFGDEDAAAGPADLHVRSYADLLRRLKGTSLAYD